MSDFVAFVEICYLICKSGKQFLRCSLDAQNNCPEAMQIWLPSEQSFLDRDFAGTQYLSLIQHKTYQFTPLHLDKYCFHSNVILMTIHKMIIASNSVCLTAFCNTAVVLPVKAT